MLHNKDIKELDPPITEEELITLIEKKTEWQSKATMTMLLIEMVACTAALAMLLGVLRDII